MPSFNDHVICEDSLTVIGELIVNKNLNTNIFSLKSSEVAGNSWYKIGTIEGCSNSRTQISLTSSTTGVFNPSCVKTNVTISINNDDYHAQANANASFYSIGKGNSIISNLKLVENGNRFTYDLYVNVLDKNYKFDTFITTSSGTNYIQYVDPVITSDPGKNSNKITNAIDSLIINSPVQINNNLIITGDTKLHSDISCNGTILLDSKNNFGLPTFTKRTPGSKIILLPLIGKESTDYAIGIEQNYMWNSVERYSNDVGFKWYGGMKPVYLIDGKGNTFCCGNMTIGAHESFKENNESRLNITGLKSSKLGPNILCNFLTEKEKSVFSIINYDHDDITLAFDTYFDFKTETWNSSSSSSYAIKKRQNKLSFCNFTNEKWNECMYISDTGTVNIATKLNVSEINCEDDFSIKIPKNRNIKFISEDNNYVIFNNEKGLICNKINIGNEKGMWSIKNNENLEILNELQIGCFLSKNGTNFTSIADNRYQQYQCMLSTEESIRKIMKMHPIEYQWNGDDTSKYYGLIAQQLKEIVPECVSENNSVLGVTYTELIPIIISAIQGIVKLLKFDSGNRTNFN